MPFIFANFNGTRGDVEVFTHEVGHAFQGHLSHPRFPIELESPTYDACEIHSMSLEFLTWPHMERFFGADAERFRRLHLAGSLLFLPYGVAIDELQHRVYENPGATPADRHAMWREIEAAYMPWRDWGDLAWPAQGGQWQQQLHLFHHPFYYIDYTLAQVCALQFLLRMRADAGEALESYRALCARGGEAPFLDLAASAGLESPFEESCLKRIVDALRPELA
jgi:M3 family oligoendopeptidase